MSGLSSSVAAVPYELKLEIRLPVAFGNVPRSVPQVSVVGPAAIRPSRMAPSAAVIATTGIVIGGGPATVGLSAPGTLL